MFATMLALVKKYFAAFCIAVFILPLAAESSHAFNHQHDFHCSAQTQKHFHEKEHHCFICDFVPLVSDKPVQHLAQPVSIELPVVYSKCNNNFTEAPAAWYFSLRGPPAVS